MQFFFSFYHINIVLTVFVYDTNTYLNISNGIIVHGGKRFFNFCVIPKQKLSPKQFWVVDFVTYGTKCSRIDQAKFVEDSL